MFHFEMDFNNLLMGALNIMLGRISLAKAERQEGKRRAMSALLGILFLAAGLAYVFSAARAWIGDESESIDDDLDDEDF